MDENQWITFGCVGKLQIRKMRKVGDLSVTRAPLRRPGRCCKYFSPPLPLPRPLSPPPTPPADPPATRRPRPRRRRTDEENDNIQTGPKRHTVVAL